MAHSACFMTWLRVGWRPAQTGVLVPGRGHRDWCFRTNTRRGSGRGGGRRRGGGRGGGGAGGAGTVAPAPPLRVRGGGGPPPADPPVDRAAQHPDAVLDL